MRNNYQKPSGLEGLTVEVRNNDINKALRTFKKKLANDGKIQEVRDRQFFVKPSDGRNRKKAAGRARWLKKQASLTLTAPTRNGK